MQRVYRDPITGRFTAKQPSRYRRFLGLYVAWRRSGRPELLRKRPEGKPSK